MKRTGGRVRRSSLRSSLRRAVAVDVLVEAARPRTLISAQAARGGGLAALQHVRRGAVLILGRLSLIDALNGVAPIRPYGEGEVAQRRRPEIIAGEGHGPAGELLVVRIAQGIGDLRRRRPGQPSVRRLCAEHVE